MLHGYGYVEFGWGLLRLVIYFLAAMRQDMSLDLYAMVKNVSTVKKTPPFLSKALESRWFITDPSAN